MDFEFSCRLCGPSDKPCKHWEEQENTERWKWIEKALCELIYSVNKLVSATLPKVEKAEEVIQQEVGQILDGLKAPYLASIKIWFQGESMANTDPVTISVGAVEVATVVGFDQNGNPYTGTIPTPSWSIDNPSFATIAADASNPANEDVTGVAPGVANLSASVVGPSGTLTDSEAITVVYPQVLTSIQIQFAPQPTVSPAPALIKK
jgi:hypothetical protein